MNHVEQWSDIIVDHETRLPQSPRQSAKISSLSPSVHEYVDEQYAHQQLDKTLTNGFHEESNYFEQPSTTDRKNEIELILVDPGEDVEISENEFIEDESSLVESYADQLTYNDAEDDGDDEKSVSSYLLEEVEQVVETIHVGEELFEAQQTVVVGIQAPNDEISSASQSDNESSSKLTSVTSSTIEDLLPSDIIEMESLASNVQKTLPNTIMDYVDISSSKTCSDEQKPEVIIVTSEEIPIKSSSSMECIAVESERITSGKLFLHPLKFYHFI